MGTVQGVLPVVTYRSALGQRILGRDCVGGFGGRFPWMRWFRFFRGCFVFFMVAMALISLPSGPCIIKSNGEMRDYSSSALKPE